MIASVYISIFSCISEELQMTVFRRVTYLIIIINTNIHCKYIINIFLYLQLWICFRLIAKLKFKIGSACNIYKYTRQNFITVFFILRNCAVFEKNFELSGYRNFVSSRHGSSNRARKNERNQGLLHEFAQKRVKVRSNGRVFMFEVVSECKRQKNYSSI